jgi:hypothetical protein
MRNAANFGKKFMWKEVKEMKSLLSIVITIAMIISTTGVSFAAFEVLGSATYPANSGTVGGDAGIIVPFDVSLHTVSWAGARPNGVVTWSHVTAGATGWKAADHYLAVSGWATYSDWGIQIYTNNSNYSGTGSPAGLINITNTLYSLPMAWRTKTQTLLPNSPELLIIPTVVDGHDVLADGLGLEYYPWFYMMDKTDNFGTNQAYATFIGSAGYQHAPGDYATPWAADTIYYVYFGANFTMALPGVTYSTNTLTVEMYRL